MAIPLHTIFLNEFSVGPHSIRLDQEGKLGLGGTVWEAALVLARFFEANQSLLTGVRAVLAVGSGTGLCGIALAKVFRGDVTITDQAMYLDLLRHNKGLNDPLGNLHVEALDWRAPQQLGDFDLIIGTDIVYDETLHEPLLNAIEINTRPGTVVFLCNERRSSLDLKFYRRWQQRGWTITMVPQDYIDPQYRCEEMKIFKAVKNSP